MEESASTSSPTTTPQSSGASVAVPYHSTVASNSTTSPISVQCITDSCRKLLEPLECNEKLTVLSMLFITISGISLPSDFLHLSMNAMQNLRAAGRSNTLYLLVKGLGTMRRDGSDSLLPVKRMPMGLIEYAVKFFTVSSVQQVFCLLCIRVITCFVYNIAYMSPRLSAVFTNQLHSLRNKMV